MVGLGGGAFKGFGDAGVESCEGNNPVSLSESSIIMQSSVLGMLYFIGLKMKGLYCNMHHGGGGNIKRICISCKDLE